MDENPAKNLVLNNISRLSKGPYGLTTRLHRRVTFSQIVNPTPHVVGDLEARAGHPGEPLRPRPPPIEVIDLSSDEELQEDSS